MPLESSSSERGAPCHAVGQYFVSPVLLWHSFLSVVLSNALYAVAFSYYHYLSFLGYSALPFLEHTEARPISTSTVINHLGSMTCVAKLG